MFKPRSFILLFTAVLNSAIAQTVIHVDQSATSGTQDGTSWSNAFNYLQDALAAATAGDQIWVAEGTYYPDEGAGQSDDDRDATFELQSNLAIYGGFPSGGSSFNERRPENHVTQLSGDIDQNDTTADNEDNSKHILTATNVEASAILDGFSISAGYNESSGGSGLLCISSSLKIADCAFLGNQARSEGGAVFNDVSSSPQFTNCQWENNSAKYGRGGAVANNDSSSPTFLDCSFSSNRSSGDGGAILNENSSPTFTNCSFKKNHAGWHGGGIYNISSSPSLTNCSFNGNFAGSGAGAVWNGDSPSIFTNCLFQGNRASSGVGTIYNRLSSPTFINCTLQGNYSNISYSGGVENSSSSPSFFNCIIWDNASSINRGSAYSALYNSHDSNPTYSHCLIQGHDLPGNGNLDGTNPDNDPLFANPIDPTRTPSALGSLRLLASSPCIDAGDNTANDEDLDLNLATRIHDGNDDGTDTIDLGAYELNFAEGLVSTVADSGKGSLRQALTEAAAGNTISFDPILNGKTISLTSGHLLIDKNVTIDGSNLSRGITIDAGRASRVFEIQSGVTVSISSLNITGGQTEDRLEEGIESLPGGGIYNAGDLTLEKVAVFNCSTGDGGSGLVGGDAGSGGGIFNDSTGILTVINSTLDGNTTGQAGTGSTLGDGAPGDGGAISNDGTLILDHVTVTANVASGSGGGIASTGTVSMRQSVVAMNSASSGGVDFHGALTAHDSINFIGDPHDATGLGDENIDYLTGDPLLGDFTNNDGPSRSRIPLSNSPLIDPTNGDQSPAFENDQRGAPRLVGASSEIGATEFIIAYVDYSASSGLQTGNSWSDAYLTLQDPLLAYPFPSQIRVAEGRYYPDEGREQNDDLENSTFNLKSGIALYGGFPNGGSSFDERNYKKHPTILSGDLSQNDTPGRLYQIGNSWNVLTAKGTDASAKLEGFTISSGDAAFRGGAGLVCNSASPTISFCIFKDNLAEGGDGGGILADNFSSPLVTNCLFIKNLGGEGGGLAATNSSSPSVIDCIFQENNSDSGGGVFAGSSSAPILTNCSFQENTSGSGGGIYCNSSSADLIRCIFTGNRASYSGGGICSSESTTSATNCTFLSNRADRFGGGAYFRTAATLTNCIFRGNNSGDNGGAIYNNYSSASFINCVLQGNHAEDDGGAVYNNYSPTSFTNCTAQGNQADEICGGMYNHRSSPSLTNILIWDNGDREGRASFSSSLSNNNSSFPTISHSLLQKVNWPINGNLDGTDTSNDPLFRISVNPANAPTTDGDLRLQTISPVVDAGDNLANSNLSDLDGNARIVDGDFDGNSIIDLGAHEANFGEGRVTSLADTGIGSLRWVLETISPGETISFDSNTDGETISLETGPLTIDRNLTIDGSSLVKGITIDGQEDSRIFLIHPEAEVSIRSVNITGGRTPDGDDGAPGVPGSPSQPGGGIFNEGSLTLERVTIYDCSTGDGGSGGIGNPDTGAPGGNAGSGGGIFNNTTGNLTLVNCTLNRNSTGRGGSGGEGTSTGPYGNNGDGGGIFNIGSLTLHQSTITGNNTNGSGGGIATLGTSLMNHSVVAENAAGESGDDFSGTLTTFQGVNFFGSTDDADGLGTVDIDYFTGDPLLDTFGDYGGPTLTRIPKVHSPLIDPTKPSPSFVPATDQREIPRSFGSSSDIGAVETFIAHVDQFAAGGQSGFSWEDAHLTLQDALLGPKPIQIRVAQGTYYPDEGAKQTNDDRNASFFLISNATLYGGFPTGGSDIESRDPELYPTILSGDIEQDDTPDRAGNSHHVVTATGISENTILDGFFITKGSDSAGAGLICSEGSVLSVRNCHIYDNHSASWGGGVGNFGSTLSMSNCSIYDNFSESGGGGIVSDSNLTLTNCSFRNNRALEDGGGLHNGGTLTMTNCSFAGNRAVNGGGLYNAGESLIATNCSLQGNKATQNGGGLYNNESSSYLVNFSIHGNDANRSGGGIYHRGSSLLELINCLVWLNDDNSSTGAAASSIFLEPDASTSFSHCLVQGWTANDLNDPSNSLDGTDQANQPHFQSPVDPFDAPTMEGNLQLSACSPVVDAGTNEANLQSTDLNGNIRVIDGDGVGDTTIDLGAYEFRFESNILYVDQSFISSNDPWQQVCPDLQSALALARPGDEIWIAEGTYYPDEGNGTTDNDRQSTFRLKPGVKIYGGFPSGGGDFSDRNPAISQTILSGDLLQDTETNSDAFHVVTAENVDETTILNGITIVSGNANGAYPNSAGGGLFCKSASPTLINCHIIANSAIQTGGGIHNEESSPILINCSISGNHTNDLGGGVYNFDSSPVLINCTLQGNYAGNLGGAIFNDFHSAPGLTNSVIWQNLDSNGSMVSSSVFNRENSVPSYSYCLVQGLNPGGTSIDGTDPANDPQFAFPTPPASAPSASGSLFPRINSPVKDVGDDSVNSELVDISGLPRKFGRIDLGAHEVQGTIYVDGSPDLALRDGTSWETAFLHVQDALAIAGPGQSIFVAQGTYYPDEGSNQTDNNKNATFNLVSQVSVYGGFPSGGGLFSERNANTYKTIFSGDIDQDEVFPDYSGDSENVLFARDVDEGTLLDGLIIKLGNGYGGGGLECSSASPTVSNCTFERNTARFGGAVYNVGNASPVFINCKFIGNLATSQGGAAYNSSAPSSKFVNCLFIGNYSRGVGGAFGSTRRSNSVSFSNCVFHGNRASSDGGALELDDVTATLTNCTFQGNYASGLGGAIYTLSYDTSRHTITNCIIWNNRDQRGIGSSSSSLSGYSGRKSLGDYTHNLFQGWTSEDLGDPLNSLDGTTPLNAPLFINPVPLPFEETDPSPLPPNGNLSLLSGSPVLDVGDDSANMEPTDLAGNPRRAGIIDLGAYEGSSEPSFALMNPGLDPDGDENNNGLSNFYDYASGAYPTLAHTPTVQPSTNGNSVTFSYRPNAPDVTLIYQKSSDLQNWETMSEGVDYTISSDTPNGLNNFITLEILTEPDSRPTLYFRQVFTSP